MSMPVQALRLLCPRDSFSYKFDRCDSLLVLARLALCLARQTTLLRRAKSLCLPTMHQIPILLCHSLRILLQLLLHRLGSALIVLLTIELALHSRVR